MATGNYGYQLAPEADAALRREALVLQHLPQVRLIAKRIHDRLPDYISLDDLVSNAKSVLPFWMVCATWTGPRANCVRSPN
jgi:hypothetical protein